MEMLFHNAFLFYFLLSSFSLGLNLITVEGAFCKVHCYKAIRKTKDRALKIVQSALICTSPSHYSETESKTEAIQTYTFQNKQACSKAASSGK